MSKFKVGDKVRVKVFDKRPPHWASSGKMDNYMGKVVTIDSDYGTSWNNYTFSEDYGKRLDGYPWRFQDSDIEPIEPSREFIVLRRDGQQVIASHKRGDEIIKRAKATCNEKDTFDFMVGAGIAFDKLAGRYVAPPKEPKNKAKIEREFKIGDRVITSHGVGEVVDVDHNETSMPYQILYDKGYKYWSNSGTAKPEPQPAHRFKVGDLVVEAKAGYGIGEVIEVDTDNKTIPYRVKFAGGNFAWLNENRLSPAPAPEPPKFYTGKVFCLATLVNKMRIPEREGHIFNVVNGVILNADDRFGLGSNAFAPYKSFSDLCKRLYGSEWREVKE